MNDFYFVKLRIFVATVMSVPAPALAEQMKISGSVQFWQRTCTDDYRCGLPAAAGERITISEVIESPTAGTSLSSKTISFSAGGFAGQLAIFWKRSDSESFLSGQSLLTKDGTRIAECSQYSSDQVPAFIPVGFCGGYTHIEGAITQYGMTYYR